MSVLDGPHQLIADLHGDLLREISALTCVHWQCLGQAARALRKRNIFDGSQAKKLILLDGAYNLSRHITVISSKQFRLSISNTIKIFSGTRQPDNTDTAPAPVDEYAVPPPVATYAATASLSAPATPVPPEKPAPMIKHAAPTPDVTCAVPARLAPALDNTYVAPANARVNRDFSVLVNPQFSIFAVEASAPQVVESFPVVDETAPPVYKQVHQEQIAAEPGSFEHTQQCAVDNIVQEQVVESVQKIPQQRLRERIEEPNKNTPLPHNISSAAPAPVIEDISPEPGVPTVPAIEHVAPAPEIWYVASVQPVTLFSEQTFEQIFDLPFPSIGRDIPEVVSSSHDAAHAASAPVDEHLAPVTECGSSASSAAHAAPTSTCGLLEQITSIPRALGNRLKRLRCLPNVTWKSHPSQVLPARRTLNNLLRNAADVHGTPLCLGSCKTRSSWLQTRGPPVRHA